MARPAVLIADDHELVAGCIAESLRSWCDIVGIVTVLEEIEAAVRRSVPDVLVLDLVFGRQSGMSMIPRIRKAWELTRIVVLTAHQTVELADAALEAGAHAFVLKAGPHAELEKGITAALGGNRYVSPLVYSVIPELRSRPLRVTLSGIERQILEALCLGCTQEQSGAAVGRTRKDVEYHLARLRRALGLSETTQLLIWYKRWRREPRH